MAGGFTKACSRKSAHSPHGIFEVMLVARRIRDVMLGSNDYDQNFGEYLERRIGEEGERKF